MASAAEGAGAKQGIAAELAVGLDTLSGNDSVKFTRYLRVVLPLDGYVFWVRQDLIAPAALLNVMGYNTTTFDELPLATAVQTFEAKGSFHYSTAQNQAESETEAVNTVIFTAQEPVQHFNEIQPNELWIGEYGGDIEGFDAPIRFAFSSRGRYYQQADLFHYSGTAILPAFETQVIDNAEILSSRTLIVSNSLPAWLNLSFYRPPYIDFAFGIPLYPSFLVPDNLPPKYGSVHIEPTLTQALSSVPFLNSTYSHSQLATDRVRITLYGLSNDEAMSFVDMVNQYMMDFSYIGLMNMPIIRDEKRVQSELGVIAQKKTIEYDVCYNQLSLRSLSRQLIESVVINYVPEKL